MKEVLEVLAGLPFGHITLLAITFTILVLTLAGLLQVGIIIVRSMLALDDANAPEWST